MQSKDIIKALESEEAKSFILNHINDDFIRLSLKYAGKTAFNIAICLQLMEIYSKAKTKIPLFFSQLLAIDQRSYEQSTSQKVALYKSTLLSGEALLDVTGGIGVDSLFFSKSFTKIDVVERNEELHKMAVFNIQKCAINNITRILGDGSNFIKAGYDWIYLDPDRRTESKRSVILENLEPNVVELMPLLKNSKAKVYIKLSPLFDVEEIWKVFQFVECIHIIAEKGEIKEVGVCLDFDHQKLSKEIHLKDVDRGFYYMSNCQETVIPKTENKSKFLLVPNALLLKSRLSDEYLITYSVSKHADFQYYFTNEKIVTEGTRTFEILGNYSISSKQISSKLQEKNIDKINIIIKGLSDKASGWHKKLKTSDGGAYYLFILKSKKKESYLCKLIA